MSLVYCQGDKDNDYKNQFLEFLRKNKPSDETPNKKEIKVKKRKRRTYSCIRYIT